MPSYFFLDVIYHQISIDTLYVVDDNGLSFRGIIAIRVATRTSDLGKTQPYLIVGRRIPWPNKIYP
jgi:hypothetical protein